MAQALFDPLKRLLKQAINSQYQCSDLKLSKLKAFEIECCHSFSVFGVLLVWWNLGIMDPSNSKLYEKEPQYNETSISEQSS